MKKTLICGEKTLYKMEEIIKNLPHTIVGRTGIPKPITSMLLTAEGIKEISNRLKEGQMVRITQWEDYSEKCNKIIYYQEITKITKED